MGLRSSSAKHAYYYSFLRLLAVLSSDPYTLEASMNAVIPFICSRTGVEPSQKAVDLVSSIILVQTSGLEE